MQISGRHFIIGCGTPKAGTHSGAALINIQDECECTHEPLRPNRLPWKIDKNMFWFTMAWLGFRHKKGIIADVSFYWLTYIPLLIKYKAGVKAFIMQRPRQDTIKSLKGYGERTQYVDSPNFPDSVKTWQDYYNLYYRIARGLERIYPDNVKVTPTLDLLYDDIYQKKVLRWLGFESPIVKLGIWEHKNPKNI